MARDENGGTFGGGIPHDLAQMHAGRGIEAGGRLVEQQHLGPVHERAGEAEPLLLTAGEHARRLLREIGESDE